MAKGRKRGRHYAARAKINLILTNPRAILIYIFLVAFLLSRPGIWAYFTDIKTATNNFSIIATYVVSFDPNGGEGTMGSQTISYNFPTPLEENTYTKEGYTFNGWNTQADGLGTSFQDMQQVLNMIPGMGNKITKEASKMTEDKIDSYKVMMSSMTEEEMLNPKIIKQSRIKRIARGSGVDETDVKDLLKYYNNTKKTMKGIGKRGGRLSGGAMNRMMGQFINR